MTTTLFPNRLIENDETDKTDSTGNEEFLQTLFAGLPDLYRPMLVSFTGNPATVPKSCWSGHHWNPQLPLILPSDSNSYFTVASFAPDEAGRYRRLKTSFRALHAVMLDDIGTKVAEDRLTLPPTWLLETSPGNFQAGYVLRQPLLDGRLADQLMNAIVAAGLCDPGANGPRTRLARLPIGVNGKHEPPFVCTLASWSPAVRYGVHELIDGLQLDVTTTSRPKRQLDTPALEPPLDGDPVWIPRPEENDVLNALRHRGLYKAPLGDGKHDITCPWVNEHTDQIDGGTAYFEPDETWPVGGFKCLHGHCSHRHIRDLLLFLEVEVQSARMKPTIRIIPGEMNRVLDAAERELIHSGRYYQRGGLIVTVITDPGTGETRVQEVGLQGLVRALSGAAVWERYDHRSKSWTRIDPPARHTAVLNESSAYPHLPVLSGLARQPYLRPDGSLITSAGHDPMTGVFGAFDARSYTIPVEPNREQAKEALTLLQGLLTEFCFTSDYDRSAALAALLTAALRSSLPQAPLFHVRAPIAGSGKSYLCRLITALATPQRGAPTSFPAHDEECRKMLLAELLRAAAVIEFDNLTDDLLPHKSLCTALTTEFISGRILGVSKIVTVSTRTLFLSSGNNVGPIQDMARRCLTIHLDPGCETPATRQYARPDLVREVLKERARYVSAALTIVRSWIAAGRPITALRSLAGYGDWSDLCRQPLLWLGYSDPATSLFLSMNDDPDREMLDRLLVAWHAVFDNKPAMIRDAVEQAKSNTPSSAELFDSLRDIAEERGELNRRRLGRWIKRHAGRIVNGRRFIKADGNRSAEAWSVETVESVSSVSSVSSTASRKSGSTIRPEPDAKAKGQLSLPGVKL